MALEDLYANQAPDPYPGVRVTQKMNIVNPQVSKVLEYYALAKAYFFETGLFPVAYFY